MSSSGYSSDEEEDIPKSSGVYLGYIDADFEEADDEPTIEDSFVGGQPIWLNPNSKPSDDLLSCKNCTGPLSLILQAFSPLEGTLYDRVIYVLACKKPSCARKIGSIRAIRGVSKDPKKIAELEKQEQQELKNQLDEKLKLDNARNINLFDTETKSNPFESSNPFGSSDNPFTSGDSSNPFSTDTKIKENSKKEESSTSSSKPNFASIAAKAAPTKESKPKTSNIKSLPEYPGYFLYVDQEKFKKKNLPKLPEHLNISENALDMDAETSGSSGMKDLSPEAQHLSNSLQDSVFQHFSEIVSYNPLQVLRYELGGKPLLFSNKDDTAVKVTKNLVPNPGFNPSSTRHFELQIMPKVIMDLEKDVDDIANGMSWGTIFVYTDVEDYIPEFDENHVGYVEEWVGVQWEEEVKR